MSKTRTNAPNNALKRTPGGRRQSVLNRLAARRLAGLTRKEK